MARVHAIGLEWATALEGISPGHQHGMRKFAAHVQPMVGELPGLCVQYGLTDEMSQLSRVVFGSHDIGRPVEAIRKHKGAVFPTTTYHGRLSVEALSEKNALDGLDPRQRFLVEFAIRHHCELRLPENADINEQIRAADFTTDIAGVREQAIDLCYFLRDRDKVEILSKGPEYLTPDIAAKELEIWYFDEKPLLGRPALFSKTDRNDPNFQRVVRHALQTLLVDPVGTVIPESGIAAGTFDREVFSVLSAVMSGGVHPVTRGSFLASERCDKAYISHSWATYMVYAAAFIFDVRHAATAQEIRSNNLLGSWMGYLERCVTPAEFAEYRDCADRFLESRTGKS